MAEGFRGSIVDRFKRVVWDPELRSQPPFKRSLLSAARIGVTVVRDAIDGMLALHATSLVYTTLLSIVPLLALSFSVLKGFGVHNQIEPLLLELFAPLGDKAQEVTIRLIDFVDNMRVGVLGALGLGILIYTVIALMQKIERAFNEVWHVMQSRSLARRFSDFLSIILLGPVLLFSAVGIGATLANHKWVTQALAIEPVGSIIEIGATITPFFLVTAVLTFVYAFVPNTKVRFKAALIGGATAGLLWVAAGWLFATFVAGSGNYTAIYSALASIIVFMIWVYVSWLILLTGASISFYVQHPEYLHPPGTALTLSNEERETLALSIVLNIARAFYSGTTPPNLEWLGKELSVPAANVHEILSALERESIIARIAEDPSGYVPGRPFEKTPLINVIEATRRIGEGPGSAGFRKKTDPSVAKIENEIAKAVIQAIGDQTIKDLALENPQDAIEFPARGRGGNWGSKTLSNE